MGRPRKPDALKLMDGTYREDRAGGLVAPSGLPDKPEWLGEFASAMWDQCIAEFAKTEGLLAKIDGPAFAAYCQAWQMFHAARERVESEGLVSVSDKGNEFQNPAVGTLNKAIDTISRLGAKFGMTPSDRAALRLPNQQKQSKVMRRQRA